MLFNSETFKRPVNNAAKNLARVKSARARAESNKLCGASNGNQKRQAGATKKRPPTISQTASSEARMGRAKSAGPIAQASSALVKAASARFEGRPKATRHFPRSTGKTFAKTPNVKTTSKSSRKTSIRDNRFLKSPTIISATIGRGLQGSSGEQRHRKRIPAVTNNLFDRSLQLDMKDPMCQLPVVMHAAKKNVHNRFDRLGGSPHVS